MSEYVRPESRTEVWAELTIRGIDLELDQVSSQLDLSPTKMWKRGERAYRRGAGTTVWMDDGWRWSTEREVSLDLPGRIEHVVEVIRPEADAIRRLSESGFSTYVEGVSEIDDGTYPLMVFPRALLAEMSDMGLFLALDLIDKAS